MIVREQLERLLKIGVPASERPVYQTVYQEISNRLNKRFTLGIGSNAGAETLQLLIIDDAVDAKAEISKIQPPADQDWGFFQIDAEGGKIIVSQPHLLFSVTCYVLDYLANKDVADFSKGQLVNIGFKWNRPVFDCCLTQIDRMARNLDWRGYIREYARLGYSHIEVNALATPHGMEAGVPMEVYPVFYTYNAGLDQFVYTKLNKGIYPAEYLNANLAMLKRYSAEAKKYGMTPGIHCFEPRNVPDTLLEKYPMLRGGRVDHPFRSLKPRFGLALTHPYVRLHYKELIQKLLKEVPDLGYMSIVTNDSGAGLEFTRSLYVGSNGGPYLIREWKSVDEVAKAAAKNAMAFFKLLQKSGAEINPKFRVMMPLEPFGQEREHILKEVGHGIDVQGASFQNAGYGSAYHHENYEDVTAVQGTAWQTTFNADEKEFMDFMKQQDGRAHVIYSHGLYNNLDPLVGIPYPRMLHKKMKAMHDTGAEYVVNAGGLNPPSLAPWNINNEVSRVFQHNPAMDLDETMKITATRWAGEKGADALVTGWDLTQEAVAAYPPVGLYSMVAMNWYRFWARPLVPNIEAISEDDREYYERYLLAPPHNPTRVDLNRDVLFDLGTKESARINVDRIDANVTPKLRQAQQHVADVLAKMDATSEAAPVFTDLADRLTALDCWMTTQRNAQAWIAGVHGFLDSDDPAVKKECKAFLKEMMLSEIDNSKKLLNLWNTSDTDFMIISDLGESVHILGENLGEILERRIELMGAHLDDDPYVDPDFIWRVPGIDFYSLDDIEPGPSPVTGQLDKAI